MISEKNSNPYGFYDTFMSIFTSESEEDKIIAFWDILRPDFDISIDLKQNNFSIEHFRLNDGFSLKIMMLVSTYAGIQPTLKSC